MRYNFRDSLGRFAKRPQAQKVRKCVRTQIVNVVPGRLYDYRGSVVRAGRLCANGQRHVSFHKRLHGFVEDTALKLISRTKVRKYLDQAAPSVA